MKLDIQDVLSRLDKNDLHVFDSFSVNSTERVELSKNISWMIPQWATAAYTDAAHRNAVIMFDTLCNPGWGAFYKHPELQTKLLGVIGSGKTVRHRFFRPSYSGNRNYMNSMLVDMIRVDHPDIRDNEVLLWCKTHDEEIVIDLMDADGIISEKDRKEILKMYRKLKDSE